MIRGFGTQPEQIQLLIDKIQHHLIHNVSFNPYDYEKLLALSTQIHYSYGMALAHAYLGQYAQVTMDADACHAHLEEARGIAELFSDCGAYEDAYAFNQKVLGVMDEHNIPDGDFYRKHALICLLRLACVQGSLEMAVQHWLACQNVSCTLGNLPLLQLEEKIRLLRGENEAAAQRAKELLHVLRHDKSDAIMLQPVYLYGLELLLHLKAQAAAWCLSQIDAIYPVMERKSAIRLQKLRVQYAGEFGLADDWVYWDFYQVTQQGEAANRVSTAETFSSLIAIYETVKEQNRMMEERTDLQTAVDQDELTHIYNSRHYNKLISKHLQDDRIVSLDCVMIDVDFFKEYNDHYGHPEGDQILKEVASLLRLCLPEVAYAARYGGDELSCLFVGTSEGELIDFVNRFRNELNAKKIQHVKNRNGNLITLSFGIYRETNLKDCNEQQLLSRADHALYQSKENGRNNYTVYVPGRKR